jgi:hypothetical protein
MDQKLIEHHSLSKCIPSNKLQATEAFQFYVFAMDVGCFVCSVGENFIADTALCAWISVFF